MKVSIDMGKGKGKGFSRIAKLVTASAREQQQVIVIVKCSLCSLRINYELDFSSDGANREAVGQSERGDAHGARGESSNFSVVSTK